MKYWILGLVVVVLSSTTTTLAAFIVGPQPSSCSSSNTLTTTRTRQNQKQQRQIMERTSKNLSPSLRMTTEPSFEERSDDTHQRQHHYPNRRYVLGMMGSSTILLSSTTMQLPAYAAARESSSSESQTSLTRQNDVKAAFDELRFELHNPNGGIARMQTYIDDNNFEALREFTKTYDQVLRKQKWGRCKSFLSSSSSSQADSHVATLRGNAVTFDLIGINRASRTGQESVQQANKYLQELKTDLQQMIDMENRIQLVDENNNSDDVISFDEYMSAIRRGGGRN